MPTVYAISTRCARCAECGDDIPKGTACYMDDDFEVFCTQRCAMSDPTESRADRDRRYALADLQRFILSGGLRALSPAI